MGRYSPRVAMAVLVIVAGIGVAVARLRRQRRITYSPEPPDHDETGRLARSGYACVPALLMARFLATGLPGPISLQKAAVSVLVAAGWPCVLNSVALAGWPGIALGTPRELMSVLVIGLLNTAMLAAAWQGWRMFIQAVPEVDRLIPHESDKEALRGWIRRRMRMPRQLFTSAGFVVMVTVVRTVHDMRHPGLRVPLLSHVIVGWTAAIAANVLYWIFTWAEGPVRLYRCRGLLLHWYDGARTPGIRCLQRIYAFIGGALAVGVIAAEVFSFLVAGQSKSALPSGFWAFLPVLLAGTALYAGAQPFYSLYLIMRRERERVLRRIGSRINDFSPEEAIHPTVQIFLESYARVSSLSTWPLTSGAVAQYVAAVLGSLVAYALGRF